jgi:hypothetical protein
MNTEIVLIFGSKKKKTSKKKRGKHIPKLMGRSENACQRRMIKA